MNVQCLRGSAAGVECDCLAIGIFDDQHTMPSSWEGTTLGETLDRWLARKEFTGVVGEVAILHGIEGASGSLVVAFGLGARASFARGPAFSAGVALSKRLSAKERGVVAVVAPDGVEPGVIGALTGGCVVGTRGPDLRKTETSRHPFERLLIVIAPGTLDGVVADLEVQRGLIVGEAINLARDLANTPPAEKPPAGLAETARVQAVAVGLKVEVWDAQRVAAERFGGLLGVSAGSDEPPAFVVLEHLKGGEAPTLALVGKGVTFDSGGLSLKPSASMEDMKSDMTGSAVVLATLLAVARLDLPVNVRGYMVITENMTGGRAMKLGDVLTTRNGKTVEVLNTDAEGRLILADALSYAVEFRPDYLIDLATLTGACIVAVGTKMAGLFSNNEPFAALVASACAEAGERVWRLPLDADFKEALKSTVADLKNVGGKWGGASTAAKFLEEFVGTTPWVHLDIAGPSWADADSTTRDAGGTGCYVRSLVNLLERGFPGVSK